MRLAIKSGGKTDALKACIYFTDGRVEQFKNQSFAFALWLALPKGTRAAFRGKGDTRPVCPWDCVDCLPGREP
jgi:hypothetical protein